MSLSDWAGIAAMLYGIHKSQQPPKFYTAPTTPQEQWKIDAGKNLFDYSSGWTDQYLRGISNLNPDFKLNTDLAGNPAFMGGLKLPNIDMSKLKAPTTGGATPTTPPPTGPGGTPSGPSPIPGDAFGHVGAPVGSPGDPFGNIPDQTNSKQINSWDDVKALGASAFNFASSLMSANPGMALSAIFSAVERVFGSKAQNELPTIKGHAYDSYKPGYDPSQNFLLNDPNKPAPREPWTGPYMGTREPTPSGTSQLGNYNAFYGGGNEEFTPGGWAGARQGLWHVPGQRV